MQKLILLLFFISVTGFAVPPESDSIRLTQQLNLYLSNLIQNEGQNVGTLDRAIKKGGGIAAVSLKEIGPHELEFTYRLKSGETLIVRRVGDTDYRYEVEWK